MYIKALCSPHSIKGRLIYTMLLLSQHTLGSNAVAASASACALLPRQNHRGNFPINTNQIM